MARKENDKDHDVIDFVTEKGTRVRLKWEKNEYRAYRAKGGGYEPMMLGSIKHKSLMEYIRKEF